MLAAVLPWIDGASLLRFEPDQNVSLVLFCIVLFCPSPDVSKMKNLVLGFGGRRPKKTPAAKARQLNMLEQMKDYCEEDGVCRRYWKVWSKLMEWCTE